jgi:MFS transporter, FSR family, fosmidomycin resistance protein
MTQAPVAAGEVHVGSAASASKPALRYWTLNASHALIDIFPIFFVTLMLPLRRDLDLTAGQETFVYMATPIFSGLCQPVLAWLSDKLDSRLPGPLGLAMGGVCIASIGFAENFWQLIALQIVGVIGTGMYHPVVTATAAQTGSKLFRNRRAQAIGIFIACGMIGQTLGPVIAPRINKAFGMEHLVWLAIPAVIMAVVLHMITRKLPHRHHNHAEIADTLGRHESARRWRAIGVLTAQNCLRFNANVGMFVMFNTWCLGHMTRRAAELGPAVVMGSAETLEDAASVYAGYLASSMTIGMGVSVLLIGRAVKPGTERGPLAYLSLIGAVAMASIGFLGDAVIDERALSLWLMLPMCAAAACSAIGFFATFPIATSLAQRLQPGHTSLVTSLMMGVGWGVSSLHALLAPVFFGFTPIDKAHLLSENAIVLGFVGFAALLVVASALTWFIPRDLVAKAAEHH